MKNVPIGLVDHFQTLYNAVRYEPSCDIVEVKTWENLPKVINLVDKQFFILT